MAQQFRRQHHSPPHRLRRLDRAAAKMNPFLALLAVGLGILNLTCLGFQLYRLHGYGLSLYTACPGGEAAPVRAEFVSRPF